MGFEPWIERVGLEKYNTCFGGLTQVGRKFFVLTFELWPIENVHTRLPIQVADVLEKFAFPSSEFFLASP